MARISAIKDARHVLLHASICFAESAVGPCGFSFDTKSEIAVKNFGCLCKSDIAHGQKSFANATNSSIANAFLTGVFSMSDKASKATERSGFSSLTHLAS